MDQLDWDYSPIRKILSSFMRQRLLPGYVAFKQEEARAYSYFLIQRDKGIIGTLFSTPPNPQAAAAGVASRAIGWLKNSQNIRRIEAQIFPLNGLDLTEIFDRHGFQHFPRHYLELDLESLREPYGSSCDETIIPWDSGCLPMVADVIYRSYKNEIDAIICEDYSTKSGCETYLRSLVDNPGCGVFIQESSYLGLDRQGLPCGFVISSRISSRAAMIPQISIHPSHQGRGLGSRLIYRSLAHLKMLGYVKVRLTVSQQNRRAYEWYRRLGFTDRIRFGAYLWQR
jgi:ribosomal protein S18 acetylase RimI-like enzyme